MLDAHQLALGAWYGFNNGWNFGPLSVRLEAWVDGNALVSFKPTQFHGDLWLHGSVDLKAFGFGFGLVLDAKITADLFKPYHLRGEFSVGVKLPWPFKKKKLGARIVLEWGPRPEAPKAELRRPEVPKAEPRRPEVPKAEPRRPEVPKAAPPRGERPR